MRSKLAIGIIITAAFLSCASTAAADVTGFIGANTSPANRQVRGASVGVALLVIFGFEFEYSDTTDDPAALAPSLKVGSANVFFQTPTAIFGFQPYFTTGGGLYSETFKTQNDKGFAPNTGGGVKISLAGPVRVRLDYRVFKLGSGALVSTSHRIYAGINLAF